MRSLLFVPGDRPDRMEKAHSSGADVLILDLEDSVVPIHKLKARTAVAEFLNRPHSVPLFVRINPLTDKLADADLEAVLPYRPAGIVLPKAEGAASIIDLSRRLLAFRNADAGILPIATETPASIFALGTFAEANARLCGLTWGAEDLPAAMGSYSRDVDGQFTPVFEVVRTFALFGAHAAGVPAIETLYPRLNDEKGLRVYAERAKRDGFSGMLAIHPKQVATINTAFTSTDAEIEHAKRVVQAFQEAGGAGAIQLDGRMLDAPHLKQALRILG
jgi:citrate lyase subunit beta/citryl-CoA lyase